MSSFNTFYETINSISNIVYDAPYIYGSSVSNDKTRLTIFRKNTTDPLDVLTATYTNSSTFELDYTLIAIIGNTIYINSDTNFYSINKNLTDTNLTTISTTFDSSIITMKSNNGILYGCSSWNFYFINKNNGNVTEICNFPNNITSFTFDENNTLYGVIPDGTVSYFNGTRLIATAITGLYGDITYSNGYFYGFNDDDTQIVQKDLSNNTTIISRGLTDFYYIVLDEFQNIYISSNNIVATNNSIYCFNEGTKILCMNQQLADEYIAIELLQIGDFVKTYKHGYRKISKVIQGSFRNNPKKWNVCMYKMIKTDTNGLTEDLIVTGGHSIMVDKISKTELARYAAFGIPDVANQTIDKKHIVPACVSDQFTPMQDTGRYNYYHLLLENNNDEEERFGIWENGILSETPNVKYTKI
jgi:hypothetical protein